MHASSGRGTASVPGAHSAAASLRSAENFRHGGGNAAHPHDLRHLRDRLFRPLYEQLSSDDSDLLVPASSVEARRTGKLVHARRPDRQHSLHHPVHLAGLPDRERTEGQAFRHLLSRGLRALSALLCVGRILLHRHLLHALPDGNSVPVSADPERRRLRKQAEGPSLRPPWPDHGPGLQAAGHRCDCVHRRYAGFSAPALAEAAFRQSRLPICPPGSWEGLASVRGCLSADRRSDTWPFFRRHRALRTVRL